MVDSVSKRFSLCGSRIGCIVSKNKKVIAGVNKLAQSRLAAPTLEQKAVIPLLINSKKYTKPLINEYKKRRDVVVSGVKNFFGAYCPTPEGAFYAFIRLPIKNSDHFCRWILEKFSYRNETVMFAPGNGFYMTKGLGKNEIRIAFVISPTKLRRAMEILRRALLEYKKIY